MVNPDSKRQSRAHFRSLGDYERTFVMPVTTSYYTADATRFLSFEILWC